MTKVYVEYESTLIKKRLIKTTCDWCGSDIPLLKDRQPRVEVEISIVEVHPGYDYDEAGGIGWGVEDLCKECSEKLRALVEQAGIKVAEIDF